MPIKEDWNKAEHDTEQEAWQYLVDSFPDSGKLAAYSFSEKRPRAFVNWARAYVEKVIAEMAEKGE